MARLTRHHLGKLFLPAILFLFATNGSAAALIFDDAKTQALAGDAEAQYQLAIYYEEGKDVTADDGQALNWFRQAAAQGCAKAQRKLAGRYFSGRGVNRDLAQAFQWYSKAAAQGDADAQYNLGTMFDYGIGATNDVAEAAQWYRRAAEQNLPEAQNRLAQLCEQGRGVKQDLAEAKKWYGEAAGRGVPEAQSKLRELGENPPPAAAAKVDDRLEKTRASAEHGDAAAQFALGLAYFRGVGVGKDLAEAVKWFRQAANQGYAKAQFSLGVVYFNQDSVSPTNNVEAVRWFRLAAEQGYAPAEFALGKLLARGVVDKVEVDKWFFRAEAQHDAEAATARAELEKTMSADQIAEAQRRAKAK